jgi:hypothetical protein
MKVGKQVIRWCGAMLRTTKSVKEQRVDGNWCVVVILTHLRYTLLGFERNYQIKIPSKQINQKRLYSTKKTCHGNNISVNNLCETNELTLLSKPWFVTGFADGEGSFIIAIRKAPINITGWRSPSRPYYTKSTPRSNNLSINNLSLLEDGINKLEPWFVTGFVDGEGCFLINIYRDKSFNTGWRVKLFLQINLHKKDRRARSARRSSPEEGADLVLMEQIEKFSGVGKIYKYDSDAIRYLVYSVKDLQVIIKHLDEYLLHTKKRADFELWKKAFELIQNKEHLTAQGIQKIVAIKASLNLGISDELKAAFPATVPVQRPDVENILNRDPYWLAGFTSAEGCFLIRVYKAKTKIGVAVKLVFQLTQHTRDEQLMKSLIEYFDCGNLYKDGDAFEYRVEKFSDIQNKIIPFTASRFFFFKFLKEKKIIKIESWE